MMVFQQMADASQGLQQQPHHCSQLHHTEGAVAALPSVPPADGSRLRVTDSPCSTDSTLEQASGAAPCSSQDNKHEPEQASAVPLPSHDGTRSPLLSHDSRLEQAGEAALLPTQDGAPEQVAGTMQQQLPTQRRTAEAAGSSIGNEPPLPVPSLLLDLPQPLRCDILALVLASAHGMRHAACVALACRELRSAVAAAAVRCREATVHHAWATDDCLRFIAHSCPRLERLSLPFCHATSHVGVATLAGSPLAATLTTLSLQSCGDIGSGTCLHGLVALRDLDLTWSHNVVSDGLRPLARQLHHLNLHGCELVDDTLCEDLPQIRELSIAYTRVGNVGLSALALRSPRLYRLALARQQYNIMISSATTELGEADFRRRRPDVTLVHVV